MINTWHQMVENRDPSGLNDILAADVVLHSPVVHTLVKGHKMVSLYLHAAFHTFLNDSFKYVREISTDNTYVLEFEAEIEGIYVNGVDMITFNGDGKIIDFKVMVRPLQAINIIHKNMGAMLEKLG